MKLEMLYIVRSRPELLERCRNHIQLARSLKHPLAWTVDEDIASNSSRVERAARIKVLALAYILSEFSDLATLLDHPKLTPTTFDRYWLIKSIEPEGTFKTLVDGSIDKLRAMYEPTGDLNLDRWLECLLKAESDGGSEGPRRAP